MRTTRQAIAHYSIRARRARDFTRKEVTSTQLFANIAKDVAPGKPTRDDRKRVAKCTGLGGRRSFVFNQMHDRQLSPVYRAGELCLVTGEP